MILSWQTPTAGFDVLLVETSIDDGAFVLLAQLPGPASPPSVKLPLPTGLSEGSQVAIRLTEVRGDQRSAALAGLWVNRPPTDVKVVHASDWGPLIVEWSNSPALADRVHLERRTLDLQGKLTPLAALKDQPVNDPGRLSDDDVYSWADGVRIEYCVVFSRGSAQGQPACALSPYGPPSVPRGTFGGVSEDAGTRVDLGWIRYSSLIDSWGVIRAPLYHVDGGEIATVPAPDARSCCTSYTDAPPVGPWSYQLEARWKPPDAGIVSRRSELAYSVHQEPSWGGLLVASVEALPRSTEAVRLASGQILTALASSPASDAGYASAAAPVFYGWGITPTTGALIANSLAAQGNVARMLWLKPLTDSTAELHQLSYSTQWDDTLAAQPVPTALAGVTVAVDHAGTYYLVNAGPIVTTTEGRDQTWETRTAPLGANPTALLGLAVSDEGLSLLFQENDSVSLATRQADGGWELEALPAAVRTIDHASTSLLAAPGRLAFLYGAVNGNPLITEFFVEERTSSGWGQPVKVAEHVADGASYGLAAAYSPDGSRLAIAISGETAPRLLVRDADTWVSSALFAATHKPSIGFLGTKVWVLSGGEPSTSLPAPLRPFGVDVVPVISYLEQ